MKRKIPLVLLVGVIALVVSACGASSSGTKVKLAPASSLPSKMREAPANVREAYQFALANQDMLEKIPCYCGCGTEGQGHKSVKECFVREVRADGTIVWDEMGLG